VVTQKLTKLDGIERTETRSRFKFPPTTWKDVRPGPRGQEGLNDLLPVALPRAPALACSSMAASQARRSYRDEGRGDYVTASDCRSEAVILEVPLANAWCRRAAEKPRGTRAGTM
jgi:hypothetical protein